MASADRLASVVPKEKSVKPARVEIGYAGFLGDAAAAARTASGEPLNNNELTAAHAVYPLGTRVRVTNEANGRSVVVRINDRCKAGTNRIINVTRRAAEELGFVGAGTAHVRLEPLDGDAE
jgi:rare lipoprotein A